MTRKQKLAALGVLGATASPAFAAIDVTGATAAVTDVATAGATLGLAVLVMLIGLKAYHWIRRGA